MTAQLSFEQYRRHIRDHYDGPAGAMLAAASILSLHSPLAGRLFRRAKFDTQGCRRILDLGSGAGQILQHLLRYAPAEAELYALDLSCRMLQRARGRLIKRSGGLRKRRSGAAHSTPAEKGQSHVRFVSADVTRLPFANQTFDAVTCGWVLEHLPDPRPGLAEMARVLVPGGRVLLFTTEDTFTGALCSRTWKCRTYNRAELRRICDQTGLAWKSELCFSRLHRFLGLGGILVEIQKRPAMRRGA